MIPDKYDSNSINKFSIEYLRKKIQFKLLGIIILALVVIISLVLVIVVETNKSPTNANKCIAAHEVYHGSKFLNVGNYSRFAVAVDSKICSKVGREIFEKGGSAVDVAIASALCNSVINCQSMGIGGGHFMNIYIKSKNKSYIVDARETAPINSYRDMFVKNPEKSLFGGLASGIPGEIRGYHEAHKIGGKLPWKELFEPTIKLCIHGFRVSPVLANALKMKRSNIKANQGLSSIFVDPKTNDVYRENDLIKMPNLAMTLRIISEGKSESFYDGILTDLMVKEINDNGGNITRDDFKNYQARVHENRMIIKLDDDYRIYVPPPPSSGILVAFILKLMAGFDLTDIRLMEEEERSLFYHRLLESFKHAYAKRSFLGDEAFLNKTFLEKLYYDLQDESYIDDIRSKIDDSKTFTSSYYGSAQKNWDHGTAHISVLGENGDAVSITATVNNYFGAKYAGKWTGIIYNDIMDDFSTPGLTNSFGFAPSSSNFIQPGKKPMSSMSPIIVVNKNDDVVLVLGASGGSKIISSVSQVALQALYMDANIKDAIDHRRVHHQLVPEYAQIEAEFSDAIQYDLKRLGHDIRCFNFGGSINQGIQRKNSRIYAYSDPRKEGEPDGI